MIAAGEEAPHFSLPNQDGHTVSLADLAGQVSVLVFYPLDFSPTCTDQLNVYQEVLGELEEKGAHLYGISVDSAFAHKAFQEHLGVTIPLLSDFHPKGEVAKQYGAFIEERGHNNRSLVMIGPDLTVLWSHAATTPLEIPGANLIFDALEEHAAAAQVGAMSASLGSAPPPPTDELDHVRGDGGLVVIEYGDYECPHCARTDQLLAGLPITRVFRHFPVVSKHPRAQVLACAAEAAARQGRFWEMHDSLFADQGHLDPPHLWERARRFEIDLERFEQDRRSEDAVARVKRDFRSGIRAGVTGTPTLFAGGRVYAGMAGTARLCSELDV